MAVRDGADQTLAALTAAAHSGHVGSGPGLVDEDEPSRIKPALARAPPLTRGVHFRAHLFGGVGGFFKLMPCRSKKRQIAEIDAGVPCSPSRSRISVKVRSGVSATSCSSQSRCRSSAVERRSPPWGRAATVPRCRQACVSLTTKLGLTANTAATLRTLPPASTCRTTRSRRSIE